MKNFKIYLSYLAVFSLLFTSCSKEEDAGLLNSDSDKAVLSFGAVVNDLVNNRAATKQAIGDMPDCNDDATADYVNIILVRVNEDGSTTHVVGTSGSPYRVNLVAGEVFTEEDAALELTPGDYRLEHFAVYDEVEGDDDLIWLAPRAGSDLSNYVDNALPLDIDLRAGVKKYVDVSVLCYDNREVNQYGYLFFELDTNVALTYCFFANYCNDDGRHYPARYNISIWSGTNANGIPLYTNEENNTGVHDNGEFFATPLCFALPDNDDLDEEYLYYEITLLDWEDNYGDVEQVMMSGTITKREILANFGSTDDDNVEYEHIRFCGDGGEVVDPCDEADPNADCDNDGVLNGVDTCPDTAGPASNNGCPEDNGCEDSDPSADCDNDGILNKCDQDNPNWNSFDCDNDNVLNGVDACAEAVVNSGEVDPDGNGCWTLPDTGGEEGCVGLAQPCDLNLGELGENCYAAELEGANADGWIRVDGTRSVDLLAGINNEDVFGIANITLTGDDLMVNVAGALEDDRVTAYAIEVRPSEDGAMSTTCWESICDSTLTVEEQEGVTHTFSDYNYSAPVYVRITAVICGVPQGIPE